MIYNLIEKNFTTPLGTVSCGLISDNLENKLIEQKEYKNGQSGVYRTVGFQIELIEFKIKLPLYNGDSLTDSNGWIWRLKKINDKTEKIKLYCRLINPVSKVEYDIVTGENLDAIEARDNQWILNIGTEDSEAIQSRALNDNWFPKRLIVLTQDYQSITEMEQNGFLTVIPDLTNCERLHIHYLSAYDKMQNDKVNTWLAVDGFKKELEDYIGIKD